MSDENKMDVEDAEVLFVGKLNIQKYFQEDAIEDNIDRLMDKYLLPGHKSSPDYESNLTLFRNRLEQYKTFKENGNLEDRSFKINPICNLENILELVEEEEIINKSILEKYFPKWEENLDYIWEQPLEECRDALESLNKDIAEMGEEINTMEHGPEKEKKNDIKNILEFFTIAIKERLLEAETYAYLTVKSDTPSWIENHYMKVYLNDNFKPSERDIRIYLLFMCFDRKYFRVQNDFDSYQAKLLINDIVYEISRFKGPNTIQGGKVIFTDTNKGKKKAA
tara:strand:+ start:404 stop:1243 length:840 start_codon:yes stop_codon:yes gene_type:complete